MKILFLDTTYPINTRTMRFIKTCSNHKIKTVTCGWNRNSAPSNINNDKVLHTPIGYGNRYNKLRKIFSFFVFFKSILKSEAPDVVFASHWDSLLLAVFGKKVLPYNVKIVYDCLDMPTHRFLIFRFFLRLIEKVIVRRSDVVITASRFFNDFYNSKSYELLEFENYPSAIAVNSIKQNASLMSYVNKAPEDFVISWIGVIRYYDIMVNFISAIRDIGNVKIFIFGDGPDYQKLYQFVTDNGLEDKVTFYGRFESDSLTAIYKHSDLVWAAYPSKDFNVKHAISNKYFECNQYRVKPIFSKNTLISQSIINKFGAGPGMPIFVDEYNVESIKAGILMAIHDNSFSQYEKELFWEGEEYRFIYILNKVMGVNMLLK